MAHRADEERHIMHTPFSVQVRTPDAVLATLINKQYSDTSANEDNSFRNQFVSRNLR